MRINFYATLRQITGQKSVDISLPQGTTVRELVEIVVTRYPRLRRELLDENNELYRHVHVFINGRDAPYLNNALDSELRPDDKVDIFPAVGGGSGVTKQIRQIRGIPLWLLREYLEEIGGEAVKEDRVVGDGWTASLVQMEDYQIGSLRVGQVELAIEGDPKAIASLQPALEKKLLRAGG